MRSGQLSAISHQQPASGTMPGRRAGLSNREAGDKREVREGRTAVRPEALEGRTRPSTKTRASFWLVAVAVCASFLLACSSSEPEPTPTVTAVPSDTATPLPSPTATAVPIPTPVRPDARAFPDALLQSSQAYFEQIAAARNTPIKAPVDMFLLTREQARDFYSTTGVGSSGSGSGSDQGSGTPAGPRIDVQQEVYELLALIPERKPAPPSQAQPPSLLESQVDNLISLITGFYSPDHNALYVVDTATSSRSTIVHELTHALQYQYADLNKLQEQRADDWDATTALLDVLEGDAVNTEIQILGFSTRQSYRNPVCFAIPAPQRAATPYVVERELDTWYEDGLCFVQAVSKERSSEALFASLPTTTEQILHPEKYLAGEGRVPVSLASLSAALGSEWRRVQGGTFGEFTIQNILLTGLPNSRPRVQSAAAGWGGDAWQLYVNGDGRVLHSSITWDTLEDAAEFWSALLASMAAQGAAVPPPETTTLELPFGTGTWRASVTGSTTTLLISNDADALQRAAAAAGLP